MDKDAQKIVVIEYGSTGRLDLSLDFEDGKYSTTIRVNGVFCHLEAMPASRMLSDYMIDDDPDYQPKTDAAGHAFLLVPYSH